MIIQISLLVITATLLIIVLFLASLLFKTNRLLKFIEDDFHSLSQETKKLIHEGGELTADLKKKSQSLDFVFKSLDTYSKSNCEVSENQTAKEETIPYLIEWTGISLILAKKIKELIKSYVK